ncbi:1-phosphofructokinase [[Bacillus] enclensis]|uniref:Tagatose-6-phosphate kinase n=1 Tax=[Bacillus] enclensis TaxID=1402860 RepID=A0A0V8HAP0_9BACI|nr:1-phosphofructokinase [[Bacillus] enclensis]KSU59482.1 1-phosphofructokinase [[Bacillus] enclensis]SCC31174.1 1-phosphofructokinase [[Bacillus] enclensis]
MIYTLTLNPSVDYIMELDQFTKGGLNRSTKENALPGGKGINVSRVLHVLDVKSTALGFAGGFTGEFIKQFLKNEQIEAEFVEVDETSRINVKVKAEDETEINGNGPSITKEQLNRLLSRISTLSKDDTLVLAGSIPASVPESFYQEAASLCGKREARIVIDAEKKLIAPVLSLKPFLIKPNHHELGEMFGVEINSVEDAVFYGKKLKEKGPENVIVSMAEKGALLLSGKDVYQASVPDGELKSSVGAGDSTVAGFLAGLSKGYSMEDSFRLGTAAGSATAFSIGLCDANKVNDLYKQIEISKR